MKIKVTTSLFNQAKEVVDSFRISCFIKSFWDGVYDWYLTSNSPYNLRITVIAYAIKSYFIDEDCLHYYSPSIDEIRAIVGPVEKAIKRKEPKKLLQMYIFPKTDENETFYMKSDVHMYLGQICISEKYRKYRINKPSKSSKIDSKVIEQAKTIVSEWIEEGGNFWYYFTRWYNSSNTAYRLKVAVVACVAVSGIDRYTSYYYKKPTTFAIKQMLPIIEKAIKRKANIKYTFISRDLKYYIYNLIFIDDRKGGWREQPKEQCEYACIQYIHIPEWESNIYGINMHKDPIKIKEC